MKKKHSSFSFSFRSFINSQSCILARKCSVEHGTQLFVRFDVSNLATIGTFPGGRSHATAPSAIPTSSSFLFLAYVATFLVLKQAG